MQEVQPAARIAMQHSDLLQDKNPTEKEFGRVVENNTVPSKVLRESRTNGGIHDSQEYGPALQWRAGPRLHRLGYLRLLARFQACNNAVSRANCMSH